MSKASLYLFAAALAGGLCARGVDCQLEFKRMTPQEARNCPGGYGAHGQIEDPKPKDLRKEPPATSSQPLYGRFYGDQMRMVFRLDESKGTGKGYDRLLLDLNHNGDLSDDPVVSRDESAPMSSTSSQERAFFGPSELSAVSAGAWHPIICGEMSIYNKQQIGKSTGGGSSYLGSMRLFAGWYLETTIDLDGAKQKIAIRDGDCNLRLGDQARGSKVYRRAGDEGSWYLSGRDYVLRDWEEGGKAGAWRTSQMLSKWFYVGGKPYLMALSDDLKVLQLQPYSGPTGEIALKTGICDLVLGKEVTTNEWEALTPEIRDDKGIVPPGNYRVASLGLSKKADDGSVYRVASTEAGETITKVEAGKTVKLQHGAPLDIQVVAKKTTARDENGRSAMGIARSLFGSLLGEPVILQMNVTLVGAGGEGYTSYQKTLPNSRSSDRLAPPWFRAFDAAGKQIASGSFEFG